MEIFPKPSELWMYTGNRYHAKKQAFELRALSAIQTVVRELCERGRGLTHQKARSMVGNLVNCIPNHGQNYRSEMKDAALAKVDALFTTELEGGGAQPHLPPQSPPAAQPQPQRQQP